MFLEMSIKKKIDHPKGTATSRRHFGPKQEQINDPKCTEIQTIFKNLKI